MKRVKVWIAALRSWLALSGLSTLTLALPTSIALAESESADRMSETLKIFSEVCVDNASSLSAAREAALTSEWAFKPNGELPSFGRGRPMQTFASELHDVELLLRPNKKRFGCLITRELSAADAANLTTQLSGLSSLSPKGKHKPGRSQYKWTLATPKGSGVVLTVYAERQPQTIILALESKGDPN